MNDNAKYILQFVLLLSLLLLTGCGDKKSDNQIKFGVSADYPPFEYMQQDQIVGFDIDLARLIAQKLNKEAVFVNIPFSGILVSLDNKQIDAAISTITVTEERKKRYDFTNPYYFESIGAVFRADKSITDKEQLENLKLACQLGTTMEIWIRQNLPNAPLSLTDNNNQAIESLKVKHVDAVIIDGSQGKIFADKNKGLSYVALEQSRDGYAIATKKSAAIGKDIKEALNQLCGNGELEELKHKWGLLTNHNIQCE